MKYDDVMKLALERGFYFPSCEIYSDAQGNREKILAVYEELKEEIVKFGNKTTKMVAIYEHENKKDKKSWWKSNK